MKRTPVFILLLALGVAGSLTSGASSATAPPGRDTEAGAASKAQARMTTAAAMRRAAVADPNLDGEVTSAEAGRYYETRFRLLDPNRDGWIDRAEFLRTAIVRSVQVGGSFSPPPTREFESVDLDGNGALTPEEFLRGALMRTSASAGQAGGPRQMRFDLVDADQDGTLSKREFMAAGAADFDRSDANGDGKVTIWEFYGATGL